MQSTIFGGPDINLFPASVIWSVETVTGGASAAYGTDAVAGASISSSIPTSKASGPTSEPERTTRERRPLRGLFWRPDSRSATMTHLLVSLEKKRSGSDRRNQTHEYGWYRARALLENTAPGAGTSPDNPFYVPTTCTCLTTRWTASSISPPPPAAPDSRCQRQPSPFVFGSPCHAHGCSTSTAARAWTMGSRARDQPRFGPGEPLRLPRARLWQHLTVYGQVISSEADFTTAGNAGLFANPPGAAADRASRSIGNPFFPASIQPAMTANGVARVLLSRIGAPEDIGFDTFPAGHRDGLADGRFRLRLSRRWILRQRRVATQRLLSTGETDVRAIQRGGIRLDRIYLASDVRHALSGPAATSR